MIEYAQCIDAGGFDNRRALVDQILQNYGRISKARGGFSPLLDSENIARDLSLPAHVVYEILTTPYIPLYPDVMLATHLIQQAGSHTMGWTNGELSRLKTGFQDLKFQRSGLADCLIPSGKYLQQFGLPSWTGGFDKCADDVLGPIATAVLDTGMELIIVDDLSENLLQTNEFFKKYGITPSLYQIFREKESQRAVDFMQITSLLELPFHENSLVLLDGDNTTLATSDMKEDWVNRIASLY